MTDLYCTRCGEKIKYTGEGIHVCSLCGYKKYYRESDSEMLELYSKAEFYQYDGQYFNALQMYEIILKKDPEDFTAYYGAILAEYGVRYADNHDGTYEFVCERTHSVSVYDSEYYKKLSKITPLSVMQEYNGIIAKIDGEQKKNNEKYLASAPVEESRDYRAEAKSTEDGFAQDYLSAREKYLEAERMEKQEAEQRRLEAKAREEAAQRARENRALLEKKRAKRKKTMLACFVGIAVLALLVSLTFTVMIPQIKYSRALSSIESGEYDAAAGLLRQTGDYRDSELLLSKYRLYGLEAGQSIVFGEYEQDAVETNGKEDIEWIVLKSDERSVTLISKYVLDCVMYHENKDAPAYWSSASLREWMNGEFFNSAFSDSEAVLVMTVHNENPDNVKCGTKGGEATEDKVYALSIYEAQEYLSEDELLGIPTAYALSKGVYTKDGYLGTYWWLRSPGSTQNSAAKVTHEGEIEENGSGVNYKSYGVRVCVTLQKSVTE